FTCLKPGVHNAMAVVSCEGAISGSTMPIMTTCEKDIECCAKPGVAVEKLIGCRPPSGNCALANYGKEATGVVTAAQSPGFCYSVTITNTGNIALQNIAVVDNVLGNLSASFPNTLPVGGVASTVVAASHSNAVVNTVMV